MARRNPRQREVDPEFPLFETQSGAGATNLSSSDRQVLQFVYEKLEDLQRDFRLTVNNVRAESEHYRDSQMAALAVANRNVDEALSSIIRMTSEVQKINTGMIWFQFFVFLSGLLVALESFGYLKVVKGF
jgi:hypothetical protein